MFWEAFCDELTKLAVKKECPPGYRKCPVTGKCIKGKVPGRAMSRGKGKGPIGIPYKAK